MSDLTIKGLIEAMGTNLENHGPLEERAILFRMAMDGLVQQDAALKEFAKGMFEAGKTCGEAMMRMHTLKRLLTEVIGLEHLGPALDPQSDLGQRIYEALK